LLVDPVPLFSVSGSPGFPPLPQISFPSSRNFRKDPCGVARDTLSSPSRFIGAFFLPILSRLSFYLDPLRDSPSVGSKPWYGHICGALFERKRPSAASRISFPSSFRPPTLCPPPPSTLFPTPSSLFSGVSFDRFTRTDARRTADISSFPIIPLFCSR